MFEAAKTAQVAAEMRNYNLTVLGVGISATRWTGFGQWRFATGESLLYSGHEEDNAPHTQGVALMLSKTGQRVLTGWETHGPRNFKTTFWTRKWEINIDVIQCYVPTNDSNEDTGKGRVLQQTIYCHSKLPKMKYYQHDGRLQCWEWQWQQRLWEDQGTAQVGRDEWQWWKTRWPMCFEQPGYWRECLPAQKDTQDNLGIIWPVSREPDRPCMHRQEV